MSDEHVKKWLLSRDRPANEADALAKEKLPKNMCKYRLHNSTQYKAATNKRARRESVREQEIPPPPAGLAPQVVQDGGVGLGMAMAAAMQ